MKNYHSLLLAKTAVCFLLISQPSQAVNPSETDLAIASPLMTEDRVVDEAKISIERDLEKDLDILKSDSPVVKIKGLDTPSLEVAPKIAQSYNQPINPPVGRPSSPNEVMVPNPEIIIKSNGTPNPTIIQPTIPSLPVLPGAVAPPVGDISVSNTDMSYDLINLGSQGNTIIPRLVLRKAPADEVLKVLARYANVNLVSIDGEGAEGANQPNGGAAASNVKATISLDIENEPVQQVFNSVLMASGLRASRRGNTIFVGTKLPDETRNIISRTVRLNQALAENASSFLALQGAQVNVYVEGSIERTVDQDGVVTTTRFRPEIFPLAITQAEDAVKKSKGVIPLDGLIVASDARLNSVTLTGEPRLVGVGMTLLAQLDARRRQVAVNVKVVDINLLNSQAFGVSFSTGNDDGFYQQNQGTAVLRFGDFYNQFPVIYPKAFQAEVDAQIQNGNGKVLTDPTLVVQEGEVASVALVQKILSGSTTTVIPSTSGGANSFLTTPTFEDVGLTLNIQLDRIDDNGLITLVVNPVISAPGSEVTFDAGGGATNVFTLVNKREIKSGKIRLRDGQTLILSGIITETDQSTITKVPILGDIPFLGVLFRKQDDSTTRSEVVVLLTPHILNDDPNVPFGYNYTPSKEASDLLRQNNFPAQAQP